MGKQTGKVNITLLAAAVLLCLVLFTTHLTAGLYARYTTSGQSSDGAKVAHYAFDVTDGSGQQALTVALSEIKKPGDSVTCSFTVTNANENGVSEVAQQYTVYVTEFGSLPLVYHIGDSKTEAQWEGSDTPLHSDILPAGTEAAHTITLRISWPADSSPELNYAGGVTSLHIRIVAEQVD